jgi:[ribosomal protein S18]-alanine N-acetyltransferase
MTAFSVRQSVPFDLDSILTIERANSNAAHWSPAIYQQIWDDLAARRVAFVAEQGGEVLGFVVGREIAGEWELENVAVVDSAKRKGVGQALVLRLIGTAQFSAATRMFLEVRASNQPAQSLYNALGFAEIGRRKNYYSDPKEDALLFEKKLADFSVKIR